MNVSARRIVVMLLVALQFGVSAGTPLFKGVVWAGSDQNYLYPDVFPYVDQSRNNTLENWHISGNTLELRTIFANQGDGLFEIRRGDDDPSDPANRDRLLQRVYINNDFGTEFEDFDIGTTPLPESSQAPRPIGAIGTANILWMENFTRFSLLEALPVGNGQYAVGAEVSGTDKASFALLATTQLPGPSLPNFDDPPTNRRFANRLSVGWGDLYDPTDPDNEINIAGVDRNSLYWLRQTVDPLNRIMESDETNNSFEVLIDLSVDRSGAVLNNDGSFVQPVPEPSTLACLICAAGSSLVLSRRRWRKRRAVGSPDNEN